MTPQADSVQQPTDASLTLTELADKCGATNAYTNSPKIGFSPEAWMRFDNALRAIRLPAAEPTTSGFTNEIGNAIRITIEGPASTSENVLTPMEAEHLRQALNKHAAAEPIQSSSAGEAASDDFGKYVALAERCGAEVGRHEGQMVWMKFHRQSSVEAFVTGIAMLAALSRQAPAAPAVDFEQWWLAEVAANGGVPIGADYKHWAKKGFELRGDARAPAAPAEPAKTEASECESGAILRQNGFFSTPPTPEADPQALLGWTRYEKARKLNPAQWAELHQRNLRGENFDDMIDALPATTMTQLASEGHVEDEACCGPCGICDDVAEPVQQDTHPDDAAVDRFAAALKAKLAKQRAKGYGGWETCPPERLQEMLFKHIPKGDPVDVGNFAMFLWARGERTAYEDQWVYDLTGKWPSTPPAEKQAAPSGEDSHG